MLTKNQATILEELSFELKENTNRQKVFCLHGNTGSGKTFIVEELKKKTNNIAFIDYKTEKISLVDTNSFEYKLIFSNQIKSNFSTSIIKLIFSSFNNPYSIFHEIHEKYGYDIGKKLYFLIRELVLATRYKQKILIIDNLNFISTEELKVFNILFDKKNINFHKYFRKLINKTHVVFIYTDNYYKSDSFNKFIFFLKEEIEVTFFQNMNLLPYECKDYILKHGIKKDLVCKYLDKIYTVSFNGNLALINASIELLKNNKFKKNDISSEVIKKLKLLLRNEDDTKSVLKTATLLEQPFAQNDLDYLVKDIHNLTTNTSELSIKKSISKFIIKSENNEYGESFYFIDTLFSDYLEGKDINENKKYYSSFAKLLDNLYSYQYDKRYYYHNISENFSEASILYVLSIIKEYRFGNFNINIKHNLEIKYRNILIQFLNAYQSLYLENELFSFEKLLYEIDMGGFDIRIIFEKDYILSLRELEIADRKSFDKLYKIHEKYTKIFPNEKELIIRSKFILFMIDMYNERDTSISEFSSLILEITKLDNSLQYLIFSLNRRLKMNYLAIIAIGSSLSSVKYFKKIKNKNILYKREYFFSLVNYSDNLFLTNQINKAFKVSTKAYKYFKNHKEYLPKISILNNYTIFYTLEYKGIKESVLSKMLLLEDDVDLSSENRSTFIMLFSNISSIYAYLNQFDNAQIYYKKAYQVLENQDRSFSRYSYHLELNKLILDYFSYSYKPDFDSILKNKKYDNDSYLKQKRIIQHFNHLKDIFLNKNKNKNKNKVKDMWELDKYLNKRIKSDLLYQDSLYQSLKFFTMQYWSK